MISIRPATEGDSADLLAWRNDERTRLASVSQEPVPAADHETWLARSLVSANRVLFIGTLATSTGQETSIGMCRFDLDVRDSAEVSINLDPAFRGRGLAAPFLAAAIAQFRVKHGRTAKLTATIRTVNLASARVFLNCGFSEVRHDESFAFFELVQ